MKPLRSTMLDAQNSPLSAIRKTYCAGEQYTAIINMLSFVKRRHMALIYSEIHWELKHEIRSKTR